jgi:chemotaxis protein CheZ
MAVRRKRFRIEELQPVAATAVDIAPDDPAPQHQQIMAELKAIRAQMAHPGAPAVESSAGASAEVMTMLETYRAQIEQCEKLKIELDLIHSAIDKTKQEIAALHGKSFDGPEMAKVTGELGAIVGGTEEATQRILEAVEEIDQAAGAISKTDSPDQHARLCQDIQDRVVSIFEACNFQDLTGQRISKVMTTMRFIEHHINVMMEIWGGVDAIKAHAPAVLDEREGDARLLNGPRLRDDDEGHASQDDIDALFN